MSEPNPKASLYRKIAKVTKEVGRVPKNGRNDFHKYNYATESDITDALRDLLADNGLAFLPPSVAEYETQGELTKVKMLFGLADCETGEVYEFTVWGEGQDKGDKGGYKAYTGAVKYALMKTFLVATGDDPEADTAQPRKQAARQQPTQPAPPQNAPTPAVRPVTPPAAPPGTNGTAVQARPATEAQRRRLFAIAKDHGWQDEEIKNYAVRTFHVESRSDMTEDQVNAFIRHIENGSDEAQPVGAAQRTLGLDGPPNI